MSDRYANQEVSYLLIKAGAGDDKVTLSGVTDDSTIFGGDGNDSIVGAAGKDSILGEAGNDTIKGGGGDDVLSGGAGNDKLFGGAGNDKLLGGAGRDLLDGDAGKDTGTDADKDTTHVGDSVTARTGGRAARGTCSARRTALPPSPLFLTIPPRLCVATFAARDGYLGTDHDDSTGQPGAGQRYDKDSRTTRTTMRITRRS